jgi:U3 small nucleolar RNA-associated protein 14
MSDDSEVDSDEAFDSADERQFGGAFGGGEGEEESDGGAISSLFSSIQGGARGGSDDDEEVEEDSEDGGDHEQLLSSVVGGGHSTRASQRAAVARAATAFSHSGSGASGVTIDSLVDSLQGQAAHGALQARFDSMGEGGAALSAPIAPVIRRRAERAVAYDGSTSHVTRWEPLVQENRQAPVLRMTAQDAKRPVASLASLASKYTPESAMEKEIAALLESSGMATAKQVAASEKAEIEALAAQRGDALATRRAKGAKGAKGAAAAAEARAKREAKRGRDELQQLRSLMFYEEVKAKRSKKIKSRAYRKIAKKQRDKVKELEREQLRALDPDAARKQDEADELERAQMRMDLTHRNLSKRSKRALRQHGGGNDAQRSALMDELKEREKLHRRMNRLGSSRENEAGVSDSDASDGEGAEAGGDATTTPLLVRFFMYRYMLGESCSQFDCSPSHI